MLYYVALCKPSVCCIILYFNIERHKTLLECCSALMYNNKHIYIYAHIIAQCVNLYYDMFDYNQRTRYQYILLCYLILHYTIISLFYCSEF